MRYSNLKEKNVIILSLLSIFFLFASHIIFNWHGFEVLYIFIAIFSLFINKEKYIYFFSFLISALLISSFFLSLPLEKFSNELINLILFILLIWFIAFSGIKYKKQHINKSYLANIVDSSLDAIVGKTIDNVVTSYNKGAEKLFGYSKEEMLNKSMFSLIPENKLLEEKRLISEVIKGKKIKHYETVRIHKSGSSINISLTLSPIYDSFQNIIGISSISRDISERIESENKLKELNHKLIIEKNKLGEVLGIEQQLNTIFDVNKLIDYIVTKTTSVLASEKCSLMLIDSEKKELCMKGYKGLDPKLVKETRLKLGDPIAGLVAQEGNPVLVTNIETDNRFSRKNRPSYNSKSFISAPIKLGDNLIGVISVTDKNGQDGQVFDELDLEILCMIVRQVAIAIENAKLYRELKNLTVTDPLTQIYNYRHFAKTLDHEIARLKRYSRSLCLLMIDIDDFKSYNDSFGHLQGDDLLKKFSQILNKNIREVDIACRYAGDEFVVILPETDVPEAEIVAEKIKDALQTISLKRKITISIGIAKCIKGMNRYDLIQDADAALFEAKKLGKNKINVKKYSNAKQKIS